jgi:hypothetical protein
MGAFSLTDFFNPLQTLACGPLFDRAPITADRNIGVPYGSQYCPMIVETMAWLSLLRPELNFLP